MTWETESEKFQQKPVGLIEIALDGGTLLLARGDIAGDNCYQGYVDRFGSVDRRASSINFQFRLASIESRLANTDLTFSKLNYEILLNREVLYKVGFSGQDLSDFKTVFSGVISAFSFDKKYFFLTVKDVSDKYFTDTYQKVIKSSDWENVADGVSGNVMPIYYGEMNYESGACPAWLVDSVNKKYLVAGHAVKSISSVFINGSSASFTGSNAEAFDGDYIATVTVPDTSETDEVTVNLQGIEDVGDGSGDLYTDPVDCLRHFLVTWLSMPTSKIDDAAFNIAKNISQGRLYKCAGGIVYRQHARDIVISMCQSMAAVPHFSPSGVFSVNIFDPAFSDASARNYSEQNEIIKDTYRIDFNTQTIFNKAIVRYQYLPSQGECVADLEVTNSESVADLDKTYTKYFQFKWTADASTAQNVAQWLLLRYRYPLATASFQAPIVALNSDITDMVTLTHRVGTGTDSGSWQNRDFEVTALTADLDRLTVTLELTDVEAWSTRGRFWLGDRSQDAETWAAASDSEKRFGYLCDRTTGRFSTSDIGKYLF